MQLAYILSIPRSGSTVLSVLLDRRRGVVSPPESSFPQVLGEIPEDERKDKRWLAALYLAATFPPTPLSLKDAEACMEGDDREILINLGLAVARKLDRDPGLIQAIVWKTPRTICMNDCPIATGGKFIVLRRNPQNVFESQFRVGFGEKNRNPYRFAIFRESYEHAFAHLTQDRVFELHYDSLPGILPDLMSFIGVEDQGEWETTTSSLDLAVEHCGHMAEVTKKFENRDPEKRARLDPKQVQRLERAMALARPMRPFLGPIRRYYDVASLKEISGRARKHYESGS